MLLESDPVEITIDPNVNIKHPEITEFDDQKIIDNILLNDIRIEVENQTPTIKGITNLGNKTTATWQSAVFSSAVVADLISGDFSIKSPQKLEPGKHEVYVTAHRIQDNTISKTRKLSFLIKEPIAAASSEEQPKQLPYIWIILAISVAGAGGVYAYKKR